MTSREVARHGGRYGYRAAVADERKLAVERSPRLARLPPVDLRRWRLVSP